MTILDKIARDRMEACNGRILMAPSCWVFEPGDRKVFLVSKDADGKQMYLVKGRGVLCTNLAVGDDSHPKAAKGGRWILWSHCRRCVHYFKTGEHRLRYPHCGWVRDRRGGDSGALRETLGILGAAKKFADDLIG